jgi:hypothetical protein
VVDKDQHWLIRRGYKSGCLETGETIFTGHVQKVIPNYYSSLAHKARDFGLKEAEDW